VHEPTTLCGHQHSCVVMPIWDHQPLPANQDLLPCTLTRLHLLFPNTHNQQSQGGLVLPPSPPPAADTEPSIACLEGAYFCHHDFASSSPMPGNPPHYIHELTQQKACHRDPVCDTPYFCSDFCTMNLTSSPTSSTQPSLSSALPEV
jgi:hypothetical protein